MTLQQIIHDVWKTNRWLDKIIPSAFFTYNYSPYERLPHAVFKIKDQTVVARTNSGIAEEKAIVEFTITLTSCGTALGAIGQVISYYDRRKLEIIANKKFAVLALIASNIDVQQNLWIAKMTFEARIFHSMD